MGVRASPDGKRAPLAIGATVLVAALAAGPAAAATRTIEVTSVTISVVRHDVPPKGYSKGDTVVSRDRLLNARAQFGKPKGAVVGRDRATMTFASAHTATIAGTATLPGGTLILRGAVVGRSDGGLAIPVVGGTGKYASAHGTLTVAPGKNHVLNTYVLVLGSALAA